MNVRRYLHKFIKKLHSKDIYKSYIHSTSKVEADSQIVLSSFGRHTYCGYGCTILNTCVDSFVSIGDNVSIGLSSHPLQYVSLSPVFLSHRDSVKKKFAKFEYYPDLKTNVQSDAWIGKGAFIKSGVTIAVGSVVGMNSVLTKSTLPYGIYAGNPAKLIRFRFDRQVRDLLLASHWWNLPDYRLAELGKYFDSPENLFSHL
ncbi:CatB-related O-acetyltransferase [Synechococcus sp. AH-707-M23]|nr:CatB-related O-acetyltransferase [Synechococcus sp. AH-707-M23]